MRKRRDRLAIWHLLQLRVGPVAREPEAGPGPDALLEQHRDSVDAKEGDDTLRVKSLWICARLPLGALHMYSDRYITNMPIPDADNPLYSI